MISFNRAMNFHSWKPVVLLSAIFFAYKQEYEIALIIIALYELFVRLGVGHEN